MLRAPAAARSILLAVAIATAAGLCSAGREVPGSPVEPARCSVAVAVGEELWCDGEIPPTLRGLCRRRGLAGFGTDVVLRPGDAVDPLADCLGGAAVGRMAPDDLALLDQPVNLNEASEAELESLPGIGPAIAHQIAAGRPYRDISDLRRVPGIGPKRLARLLPRAVIGWRSLEAHEPTHSALPD